MNEHAQSEHDDNDDISEEVLQEAQDAEREEGVLVRIVEWMEWIPSAPSPEISNLAMTNGFTGFVSLKNERLIDLGVSGTGRNYEWEEDDPDNPGEKIKHRYGLYAFQAILAQNVSKDLVRGMLTSQALPMHEERARTESEGRDKRDDLIVVENQPPQPNRNDRRGGKARKKRR